MARPAFPVMRAGEELIDERCHGGSRVVRACLEERIHLLRCWRQPDQVEKNSTHEFPRGGGWRGREFLDFEPGQDETVHRRVDGRDFFDRRERRAFER